MKGVLRKSTVNNLKVTQQTMTEGTTAFKMIILSPLKFLMGLFSKSTGLDLGKALQESSQRSDVSDAEDDINQSSDLDETPQSQYDGLYKSPLMAST